MCYGPQGRSRSTVEKFYLPTVTRRSETHRLGCYGRFKGPKLRLYLVSSLGFLLPYELFSGVRNN